MYMDRGYSRLASRSKLYVTPTSFILNDNNLNKGILSSIVRKIPQEHAENTVFSRVGVQISKKLCGQKNEFLF